MNFSKTVTFSRVSSFFGRFIVFQIKMVAEDLLFCTEIQFIAVIQKYRCQLQCSDISKLNIKSI